MGACLEEERKELKGREGGKKKTMIDRSAVISDFSHVTKGVNGVKETYALWVFLSFLFFSPRDCTKQQEQVEQPRRGAADGRGKGERRREIEVKRTFEELCEMDDVWIPLSEESHLSMHASFLTSFLAAFLPLLSFAWTFFRFLYACIRKEEPTES